MCDQYPYALVLIEPIKFRLGASFARRSGKFATNPSVLDYLRDTSSKKSPGSIVPGMYLIALVSDKPGTLELRELSLAIRTPDGLVLVVGCSHPGVEHIMQEASAIDPHINLLLGGLHQIQASDPEVERIARVLHDQYKLDRIAPGHCTGEPEFAALKKTFGDHYVYAGVGSVVDLPK